MAKNNDELAVSEQFYRLKKSVIINASLLILLGLTSVGKVKAPGLGDVEFPVGLIKFVIGIVTIYFSYLFVVELAVVVRNNRAVLKGQADTFDASMQTIRERAVAVAEKLIQANQLLLTNMQHEVESWNRLALHGNQPDIEHYLQTVEKRLMGNPLRPDVKIDAVADYTRERIRVVADDVRMWFTGRCGGLEARVGTLQASIDGYRSQSDALHAEAMAQADSLRREMKRWNDAIPKRHRAHLFLLEAGPPIALTLAALAFWIEVLTGGNYITVRAARLAAHFNSAPAQPTLATPPKRASTM